MSSEGSVTRMIAPLQAGDSAAVQQLWQRYFHRLVGLARARLASAPRRVADEEDVALSAFDSFCRNAEQGRFPDLSDRDRLWRLLVVMTARKAGHLRRDQARLKRGGGAPIEAGEEDRDLLQDVLGREPDPAFAASWACSTTSFARWPCVGSRATVLKRSRPASASRPTRSSENWR
jgi:hypothetical protein